MSNKEDDMYLVIGTDDGYFNNVDMKKYKEAKERLIFNEKTLTNNFNYQEMISAIDKIQRWPSTKQVKCIKMSFDFYSKIKYNISIENRNNQLFEKFCGIPIEVVPELKENYKFEYE